MTEGDLLTQLKQFEAARDYWRAKYEAEVAKPAYEWGLRKGLDMSPEEEEMLTPEDWAALRDIIRAAVDRHQARGD